MKYIISINHTDLLIPDETKAMMGAVEVRERSPYNGSSYIIHDPVRTKIEPVHPKSRFYVKNEDTGTEEEVTATPAKPRKQIGKPQLLLGS